VLPEICRCLAGVPLELHWPESTVVFEIGPNDRLCRLAAVNASSRFDVVRWTEDAHKVGVADVYTFPGSKDLGN
jgi:hypothetical protein